MGLRDEVISIVIENEGGYVNSVSDPGGETKYGITKRWWPDVDIRNLTPFEAARLYHKRYDNHVVSRVKNLGFQLYLFDALITGQKEYIELLQVFLNSFEADANKWLECDGIIGPATVSRVNDMSESITDLFMEYSMRNSEACAIRAMARIVSYNRKRGVRSTNYTRGFVSRNKKRLILLGSEPSS